MPFILTAANCPVPIVAAGIYDVTTGPLTSKALVTGDAAAVASKVNENAARSDISYRYGGGGYAVATGLTISAGAGLTLNVADGIAVIDGSVRPGVLTITLTDNIARSYVYLMRDGTLQKVNNSLTPPAGAGCFLGSAGTSGGAITSVDQSGVLFIQGGTLFRRTADTGIPGDTPPASLQFVNHGSGQTWWWDGVAYSAFCPALPLAVANGGTGATTAAGALLSLGAAPAGQYTTAVNGNITLTSGQIAAVSDIELTAGTQNAAFTVTFPNTGLTAGQDWSFANRSGQTCQVTITGGSNTLYVPAANNQGGRSTLYYDGVEIRRAGREGANYSAPTATSPTQTYSTWDQVDNELAEYSLSGGNVTIKYPSTGTLSQRGRMGAVQNSHATAIATVQTNGATADTWMSLLPGEYYQYVVTGSGGIVPLPTRPNTRRVGISFGSDADKTVASPDFLAVFLEITSSVSLTATRNLLLPLCDNKEWFVLNNTTGGQSILVKASTGTGVTLRPGKGCWVRCDGTNYLVAGERAMTAASSLEVPLTVSSTATVSNTTTETSLLGTQIGTNSLPANLLTPGRTLRFTARGLMGSDAAAHTLNLKFKVGAVVVVTTGAQTPPNSLSSRFWEVEILFTCRTTGAAGAVIAQGRFSFMSAATGSPTWWEMTSGGGTLDTTSAQTIDLTATYGAGVTASDTISCSNVALEVLN